MVKELPLQRICELLRYDEETGNLYWKASRGGVLIGDIAGNLDRKGYIGVRIDGNRYLAHRIIYASNYLKSSVGCIDHIDGNPSNNRLSNLREVSGSVNQQNNKARGTHQAGGRWVAQIKINSKSKNLGSFDTEEEAHQAYLAAKKIYHPEARRN
jgi:hypothetical protein